jgi:alkanesulfonate monooxygenase SsuD/methylene tetrahydromethanopterin reductase-like flavin-dependent oxidoreductase (luciferase family)
MNLGRLGVFCFTDALTPAQLTELVQQTERLGYAALWYPEVLSYESLALGSFLLTRTKTLIVASGIANIYARDATAAKQGQHTLAKLSGGRFVLGVRRFPYPPGRGRPRPSVPHAHRDHACVSGCDGQGSGHRPAAGGVAPDGAGGLRPPDDRPSG